MLSTLPSQDDVKKNWKSDEVKVTCVVTCYNHERYIFDCLKGIVCQKTDFSFKVVVYDDFSTDGTRDILKGFEERYPEVFDIYYADFNHYGVAQKNEHLDKLEGDYIAMCEGDDYWLDNYKIKKQLDALSACKTDFCIHPAVIFMEENGFEDVFCYYGNEKKVLPQRAVFEFKNQFSPTASYFLKKEKYQEYIFFRAHLDGGPGDFYLEAIASDEGILYLPDIMSAYRRGSAGSYSSEQRKLLPVQIKEGLSRWEKNLDTLSDFYPKLKYLASVKLALVEVDCLIRLADTSSAEKAKDYIDGASSLLRKLGPVANFQ